MRRPFKAELLPETIRQQLNEKLVANAFSGYQALADWLQALGYEISASAVNRYGQKFRDRIEAIQLVTAQSKTIIETCPDDANSVAEAVNRLAQQQAFDLLLKMEVQAEELNFPQLLRAIADLNRSSTQLKRYQQDIKEKAAQAAQAVTETMQHNGLGDEVVAAIKDKILGIAA